MFAKTIDALQIDEATAVVGRPWLEIERNGITQKFVSPLDVGFWKPGMLLGNIVDQKEPPELWRIRRRHYFIPLHNISIAEGIVPGAPHQLSSDYPRQFPEGSPYVGIRKEIVLQLLQVQQVSAPD